MTTKVVLNVGVLIYLSLFCGVSKGQDIALSPNSRVNVISEWDLRGQTLEIPQGVTLYFKEGTIKNGILIGNGTQIKGRNTAIFENVVIQGDWIVPRITTKMFVDLSEDNSLRNVFALANPDVKNRIVIIGDYNFNLTSNREVGVSIPSNTKVSLKGKLLLRANSLISNSIVFIGGKNIVLSGGGSIVGDSETHLGTEGEWGMGLEVYAGDNVIVRNIEIRNCWGDCVYIGHQSKNISLIECSLRGGRRQGISITSADNVLIDKCEIKDIRGTHPQNGIAIEPNSGLFVQDITISNVVLNSCGGCGIAVYGKASNAHIGLVNIINCQIGECGNALAFRSADRVILKGSSISSGKEIPIFVEDVQETIIKNNHIFTFALKCFETKRDSVVFENNTVIKPIIPSSDL